MRPPRAWHSRCSRLPWPRGRMICSALESLGEVLGRLRRPEEGLAAYKIVLGRDPTRQTALEGAAHLAFKAGRHKESVELWKRAIAVNPWRTDYHA